MPCQPLTLTLSATEQQTLEKLVNRRTTPQQLALRARIVLCAAEGHNNAEVARRLDISIKMVRQWRRRWVETAESDALVSNRLADEDRPGAPMKFTLEQQVDCLAIACRDPREYGDPSAIGPLPNSRMN